DWLTFTSAQQKRYGSLSVLRGVERRISGGTRFRRSRRAGSPGPEPKREGDTDMRFMMLMIPKGYEKAEPGTMPDAKAVAAMMKYNESLQKAGVLLALDRLH